MISLDYLIRKEGRLHLHGTYTDILLIKENQLYFLLRMEKKSGNIQEMPFGTPHAALMSDEQIKQSFFDMPNMRFTIHHSSFAYTSRRGGGKTHLLRKMYFQSLEEKSSPPGLMVYEKTGFATDYLLGAIRKYKDRELKKHLQNVWEMVLALRVAGLFLKALRSNCGNYEAHERKKFISDIERYLALADINADNTAAIYTELINKFARKHYGETEFFPSFNRRQLVECLSQINLTAYLFFDDMDDNYHDSPSFWNINLSSLYEAIIFMRNQLPKVHFIIAMRREIYDYIQHYNPNWTRYAGPDNVKDIVWDKSNLKMLFENKIEKLPLECLHFKSKEGSFTKDFLGLETIVNDEVGKKFENIFEYILRHTFYRARDIIYMGNEIWNQIRDVSAGTDKSELERKLRDGVALAARSIAQELITECDAVIRDLTALPLDTPSPTIYLLGLLPKNIITKQELQRGLNKVNSREYPKLKRIHPYCILAKWGLIGWASKKQSAATNFMQRFSFEAYPNERKIQKLPESDRYFIHPALYDIQELQGSLRINDKVIVGHDYDIPSEPVEEARQAAEETR